MLNLISAKKRFISIIKSFFKNKFILIIILILFTLLFYFVSQQITSNNAHLSMLEKRQNDLTTKLNSAENELNMLKSQDQYVVNKKLEEEIKNIQSTFKKASDYYEKLLDLKTQSNKTGDLDKLYAKSLSLLAERNYASAEASLDKLKKDIDNEKEKITATFQIPANIVSNNTPPGSGYRRQVVNSEIGEYLVDVVSADLNSTKVIVDTASDSDCKDNCPVLSLADYVSRNGAFAGINGSYFCPASYPSCSGKANSFDTLLMNKNKKYFNSDNNVYSNVPAVIFSGNSARYVGRSLEWGRDTGVDSVIANQPLLVLGGNVVFGGDGEVKRSGKGSRSFIGNTGSTVYIGVVHNVNAQEMARVLKTMGIENALNLDSGGSTALWSGGYKVGPGRNIPNAILFVKK